MGKYIHKISVLLLIVTALCSCETILEYPDENAVDPTLVGVTVRLNVKPTDLTDEGLFPRKMEEGYSWRLVLEVYKFDNSNEPIVRYDEALGFDSEEFTVERELQLSATKYRVVAWLDYVPVQNYGDYFYQVRETLRSVFKDPNRLGNSDMQDAYYGFIDLDFTHLRDQWNTHEVVELEMSRPIAKYILIAKDVDSYLRRIKEQERVPAASPEDLATFKTEIFYQGYRPYGLDAYTGKLNDAATGLTYQSCFEVLNDDEAIIASDYPFANGPGSEAVVTVRILDSDGVLVNEVSNVQIPIARGELTVIRMDFLTTDYQPGIVIDPEYDGEFDVVLPD